MQLARPEEQLTALTAASLASEDTDTKAGEAGEGSGSGSGTTEGAGAYRDRALDCTCGKALCTETSRECQVLTASAIPASSPTSSPASSPASSSSAYSRNDQASISVSNTASSAKTLVDDPRLPPLLQSQQKELLR